jgi:hypothetical protein
MIPVHVNLKTPYTCNGTERGAEGEVRAVNGQIQVYNGSMFEPIRTTAWVDDIDLKTVVDWAKQKMEQELREQQMAEQFPAFAKAKENYEMIRRLVENELA